MISRPIVAIIGRPNVGKSSLFNRFLRRREAIVSPIAGTTRDRLYATVECGDFLVDLVDTAGLASDLGQQTFGPEMLEQVQLAVQEADVLLFVLNAQEGLTHQDQMLADIIRKSQTPTVVFVNKVDNLNLGADDRLLHLGLGPTVLGSITQRRGLHDLVDAVTETLKKTITIDENEDYAAADDKYPRIALVGRPNVGKSTLYNALVGDERVIVSDVPGTTRDTVDSKLSFSTGETYIVTDTAGLRRRGKIGMSDKIEQYSVVRTLRAIDYADLVILLVDAEEGLTRGDVHVAMHALEQKKRFITAINKTDLIDAKSFNFRRFPFLAREPMVFISAKERRGIEDLLLQIQESLHSSNDTPDQSSELETPPATPAQ